MKLKCYIESLGMLVGFRPVHRNPKVRFTVARTTRGASKYWEFSTFTPSEADNPLNALPQSMAG